VIQHDSSEVMQSVVALAGRRIDAEGATIKRFPLEAVKTVAASLDALFAAEHAVALVCSAACGSDLIALDVAGRRALRRRIVLPSEPKVFLQTSVIDRPGGWAPVFERIIDEVHRDGDLVIARPPTGRSDPYHYVNEVIIAEARRLTGELGPCARKVAVIIWEGEPRDASDITESFRRATLAQGYKLREILTLSPTGQVRS
jgi:hypothetical protein